MVQRVPLACICGAWRPRECSHSPPFLDRSPPLVDLVVRFRRLERSVRVAISGSRLWYSVSPNSLGRTTIHQNGVSIDGEATVAGPARGAAMWSVSQWCVDQQWCVNCGAAHIRQRVYSSRRVSTSAGHVPAFLHSRERLDTIMQSYWTRVIDRCARRGGADRTRGHKPLWSGGGP